MEALLMKFPKKDHIHNLGAYINMLQTKNKSIETIYFSKILSMDPLIVLRDIIIIVWHVVEDVFKPVEGQVFS